MAETLSLMEFLQALLADAELRAAFGHDPEGTLADHGLGDLTPADVHDALVLVQDNETVDYSLDAIATAPPPPPPAGDGHEAAVGYLQRYLGDPAPPAVEEQWADVDPDAGSAPDRFVADDAPAHAFGVGADLGYGAGAAAPAPADPGDYDLDDYDLDDYDLDDVGDLDDLGTGGTAGNLPGEDLDDVPGLDGSDDLDPLDDLDDIGSVDPADADPGPPFLGGA